MDCLIDNRKKIKGYVVAGFWIRMFASFLDNVILMIPLIFLFKFFDLDMESEDLSNFIMNIIIITACILMWVKWGKTPGKALLKIKIISMKEGSENITFDQGLIRYLGYLLSTVLFFIGFLMIAFREDKRGLHDLISNTCVVYEK